MPQPARAAVLQRPLQPTGEGGRRESLAKLALESFPVNFRCRTILPARQ